MASTNNFSNVDVVIEVNGKDVKLCVEYWVDYGDDWAYYVIETVNGLPSDIFADSTIDHIMETLENEMDKKNTDLACSNLMCNEDY